MYYPGIVVSSSFVDLEVHRARVRDILLDMRCLPIQMERNIAPLGAGKVQASLEMVRASAGYIGLIGWRYGKPPKSDGNPSRLSLTELEFEEAVKSDLPILIFVMTETHPIQIKDAREVSKSQKQVEAFLERVSKLPDSDHRIFCEFSSETDLSDRLSTRLASFIKKVRVPAEGSPPERKGSEDSPDAASGPIAQGVEQGSRDWEGWPYPGFSKFSERHWDIFCGRGAKIEEVFEALQGGKRIIALVGASGTGKSSLLQAGVVGRIKYVPAYSVRLRESWRFMQIEVEQDIDREAVEGAFFGLLADRFAQVLSPKFPNCESTHLYESLRLMFIAPSRESFDFEVTRAGFQEKFVKRYFDGEQIQGSQPVLAIVINQAEYIRTSADRDSFLRFVVTAGLCDNIRILMTLRDTEFGSFVSDPGIDSHARDLFKGISLAAPNSIELVAMIGEPARIAGIYLEPELISEMLKESDEREGNALPLVAQCLHVLARNAGNKKFTRDDYRAFNGLRGVVISQANKVDSADSEDALEDLFYLLVGAGTTRQPASSAQIAQAGVPETLISVAVNQSLVEALPDGRFMLSHDALFDAWPRLNQWLKRQRRRLDLQTALLETALRWTRAGAGEEIRLSRSQLEMLEDGHFFLQLSDVQRRAFEAFKAEARRQADRLALVQAINAGLPIEIYKKIDEGVELTVAELGEGPEQLRAQFWSAVTGKEVPTSDGRSIFDDRPKLLNSCVTRGVSVLALAALCGRVAFLRELHRRFGDRLDLSRTSESGGTILGYAAYAGRRDVCDFLIDECKIPVDLCECDEIDIGGGAGPVTGMSAAGWAINQRHNELAQYLHRRGSPLDFSTILGWNRLSESVRNGDLESVKAAIASGFQVEQRFPGGQTCMHIACRWLHPQVLEYLIKEARLDVRLSDDEGHTAYDYLVEGYEDAVGPNKHQRAVAILRILVREGLPIDGFGKDTERALLQAAQRGHAELVRALIQAGAVKEPLPSELSGPLWIAAMNHRHRVAEVLLAEGAGPNGWGIGRVRPLHVAAASGDLDMVEILIAQKSIKLDVRGLDARTPLMLACEKGHMEIARLLMEWGANPALHDQDGVDALAIALGNSNTDLVAILLGPKLQLRESFNQASVEAELGQAQRTPSGNDK